MSYLNIPANGWPQLKDLEKLDKIAQQIGDLPTFTSDDRAFLEALPAFPTEEGKKVLTAITDEQGDTDLTYETPEVEGADIATTFSESVTYPAGTLVYYGGILYKFTEDHVAGAWDPSEVTTSNVATELIETNAAVDELKNTLSDGEIVTITSISGASEGVSLYQDNSNYKKHGQVACFLLHINVPPITVGSTISFTLGQYPSNAMDDISISGFCASTAFLGTIAKGGSVTIRVLGANLTSANTVRFYALIPLQG